MALVLMVVQRRRWLPVVEEVVEVMVEMAEAVEKLGIMLSVVLTTAVLEVVEEVEEVMVEMAELVVQLTVQYRATQVQEEVEEVVDIALMVEEPDLEEVVEEDMVGMAEMVRPLHPMIQCAVVEEVEDTDEAAMEVVVRVEAQNQETGELVEEADTLFLRTIHPITYSPVLLAEMAW